MLMVLLMRMQETDSSEETIKDLVGEVANTISGNARRDFRAKTRTVEYAVMADGRLQPVRLPFGGNVHAQPMRGLGLAHAGNIVVLAFDGEQAGTPDDGRIDRTIVNLSEMPASRCMCCEN